VPLGGADKGSRRIVAAAVLGTVTCSALGAAVGPTAAYGVLGGLLALSLATTSALYPVFATYVYLATLPIIAGIDRDTLLPLVRPNEGLLAVVMAGAMFGAFLRYLRGDSIRPRFYPMVDVPLAVFLLMSTVWPIASMNLRGLVPTGEDLASILPMAKLVGIYFLVRYTVTTEQRIVRAIRFIVWPGALVALIAVLQTLKFGPVLAMLNTLWVTGESVDFQDLSERGSATLGSPIATGDVIIISLVLVLCCGARGVLGRRERLVLALLLGTGVFAAGQFSTWIAAAVSFALIGWRFPALRRQAKRFAPLFVVALVIGAPAFIGRLEGIGATGSSWLPEPEQGRLDNLAHLYLPHFNWVTTLIGVSPNWTLRAPEIWRNVVYLESGVLWFVWVGGTPLLAAFIWLSVRILRAARPALTYPGGFGSAVSALDIVWRFLLVLTLIDPHLQQRGTGDLIFTLLAIAVTGLDVRGIEEPPSGLPSFMIGKEARRVEQPA
jgi:hypothetical protein